MVVAVLVLVFDVLIIWSLSATSGSRRENGLAMMTLFAWQGSWFSLWTLWGIGVRPWRQGLGFLAVGLGLVLATTAWSITYTGFLPVPDANLAAIYSVEVAGWMLLPLLFGLRVVARNDDRKPYSWQWSLRTLIAIVAVSSIILGTMTGIYRSMLYDQEHRREFLSGLGQLILLISLGIAATHATVLTLTLVSRLLQGAAWVVGSALIAVNLFFDFGNEPNGLIGLAGGVCLSSAFVCALLEWFGWHVVLTAPPWEPAERVR